MSTTPGGNVVLPHRGRFTFPSPYNTIGVRVTNEDDGEILPRTYAYWCNINAHRDRATLRVFLGTSRGPCWWEVDKSSHVVTPMGPLFAAGHPLATSTAEGWYWDASDADLLYCADDQHLYRYNLATQELVTVVDVQALATVVDLARLGGVALRQWHTSSTRAHSATVKQIVADGAWPAIGTIVYDETAAQPWRWFPAIGALDESQIDRTGDWLMIKETLPPEATPDVVRPSHTEDNRIIRLADGHERYLLDEQGAAGHSDSGYGYMVAADNWQREATWRVWAFGHAEEEGRVVLTTSWEEQVIHVSHGNARPGPAQEQSVLGSGTLPDLILIPLDGSGVVRAVAPSMSAGGDYDDLPKANLDPPGLYALWTRRAAGRFDAFLVQLPSLGPTPPTRPPTWRIEGWGPSPIVSPLGP